MTKRPILASAIYWGAIGLVQLYLAVSCGFGAGWDEESHIAIMDCRADAQLWMQVLNVLSIVVYSVWVIVSIRRLRRGKD